jgi:hypothetical protein
MDLKKLDTSKIEKVLYDKVVSTGACPNVYGGPRNSLTSEDEMIFCVAPNDVRDESAIGRTIARIEIYAKNISGLKNAEAITRMRDVIVELIPIKSGNYFFDFLSEISPQTRDGYSSCLISLIVIID